MGEVMTLPGVKERQLDLVCKRLLALTNPRVKGDGPGEREQRDRTLRALMEILRGRRPDARLIDLFELDANTRMAVAHLLSLIPDLLRGPGGDRGVARGWGCAHPHTP